MQPYFHAKIRAMTWKIWSQIEFLCISTLHGLLSIARMVASLKILRRDFMDHLSGVFWRK